MGFTRPMQRPQGSFALVAVLALAFACTDPAAQLVEHAAQGQAYLDEEKWQEAEIEFRNMLQIDPNAAAAHWGLAQARLGGGDVRGAYWELQETVRLDPDNIDARLRYGQFQVFGGPDDLEAAVQNADEILEREPSSWQAYVLRARALGAMNRPDEVGEALAKAAEVAPEEAGPLLLYANYLRSREKNEEAEALFRRVKELEPGFPSFVALAGFLASLDRDDEAEVLYQKALEVAEPEQRVSAYTMFANHLMARDRGDDAERVLREGIAAEEGNVDLIYTLARFYHVQGRREQADAMILEATQADPTDPTPFLLLSNYRAQSGDHRGALKAAEQALEADPDFELARLRKAEVLVDIGYREKNRSLIADGRAVVDEVLSRDEGLPQALFVKAKIDMAESKYDDAIAALRRAIDGKSDWAQAHYLLASVLFVSGDRSQARAAASRAIELDPNLLDAHKLLARIHAALGDHTLAIETGQRVLEVSEDLGLRILIAQSQVRSGDLRGALADLERIPPEARIPEVHFALGRVHVLLGNLEQAKRELLAAQKGDPHRYEVLRALLGLELRTGDVSDTVKRVTVAVAAKPTDSRLRQLEGEVALLTNRPEAAEAAFQKAIELDPNDIGAYEGLARFLTLTGQADRVRTTYESALAANPTSGVLHLVVGSLNEMEGKTAVAIERYEEAIRLSPELAVAKNNLAYLLAEQGGNLDRALDLAQEAKALLPDNPNAADTLGWVLYKKDVPSAAIDYLREAVGNMQPDNGQISLVRHHLALAYEADAQPEQARGAWKQALQEIDQLRLDEDGKPTRPAPPWAAEVKAGLERLGS